MFKGIALLTPGGDLVYCRDEQKRARWHLNLCAALQEHLGLPEPPHFLVPCFTATVDRWLDRESQVVHTFAETHAPLWRYQALLNALFGLDALEWQVVYPDQAACSPSVLMTYREQFPQLWDHHDLVLDVSAADGSPPPEMTGAVTHGANGLVLRLFVSGHSALTEQILQTLQGVLETSRHRPYTLKVIDVAKHPDQAEADQISATPTLIRIWPLPVRRLVGDLDDPRAILNLLSD